MESNYERVKKEIVERRKDKIAKGEYSGADYLQECVDDFTTNVCIKLGKPLMIVNKEDALKEYNKHTLTTEFTKILKDGTERWHWTIRDKKAYMVGYIFGLPSREQRQDKSGKLTNNAWLSRFDFMELNDEKIAG